MYTVDETENKKLLGDRFGSTISENDKGNIN
jgi:hypothetical protein